MAVNVSSIQLRQPSFLDFVNETLAETGTSPNFLELEITESIALEGLEAMIALLTSLRSQGIRIAIDDFGTGYSSLNYLERLPIDHLKIDRSFVLSLAASERGARIVRTIAMLGAELNVKTGPRGREPGRRAVARFRLRRRTGLPLCLPDGRGRVPRAG
jgi:EAL domain-containing protein (putative c-di-GMP-specific phosphodiesterase class I)